MWGVNQTWWLRSTEYPSFDQTWGVFNNFKERTWTDFIFYMSRCIKFISIMIKMFSSGEWDNDKISNFFTLLLELPFLDSGSTFKRSFSIYTIRSLVLSNLPFLATGSTSECRFVLRIMISILQQKSHCQAKSLDSWMPNIYEKMQIY